MNGTVRSSNMEVLSKLEREITIVEKQREEPVQTAREMGASGVDRLFECALRNQKEWEGTL